jgi:hypothetical protein
MSFTTPQRPFDVTALIPQLAPLARTATRLHPRPGSSTVHDSTEADPGVRRSGGNAGPAGAKATGYSARDGSPVREGKA